MIYTIEKANLVASQLRRFTTGNTYYVVGQYANIDFWIQEVVEAQEIIDDYRSRFVTMSDAQKEWVEKHDVRVSEYCAICRGKCEFDDGNPPSPLPPRRMSSSVLDSTRRELVNAMYYFLTRCYRIGLVDDKTLKQKCDSIGTGIDPNDLKT